MIKSVNLDKTKRYLNIVLNTGQTYSSCDLTSVTERLAARTMVDIHPVLEPSGNPKLSKDGSDVTIRWSDDHSSTFKSDWLIENRFTKDGIKERKHLYRLTPKIWGKSYGDEMVKMDFNKFMTDDKVTYHCLVAGEELGLYLLENAPEKGAYKEIAARVNSWLRPQNHGTSFANREIWHIHTDMKQINHAYSSKRLNYHTDLAHFGFPPGLGMLHCVEQTPSKGGDSLFSDGFKAASIMRGEYPELFDVLTNIPVSSIEFGCYYYDYHLLSYGTTIKLDAEGELESIRFSNHVRYSALNAPLDQVEIFYKAYKKFEELLEENHVEYRLKPGDIICIDNHRVLHGRLPFEMSSGTRHLEGTYIEWDDLWSARRILQRKLKESP